MIGKSFDLLKIDLLIFEREINGSLAEITINKLTYKLSNI
tara:strand:+ start:108 stop:227 length:120 start_codon:yes stop_codon:yes gene_type:complete